MIITPNGGSEISMGNNIYETGYRKLPEGNITNDCSEKELDVVIRKGQWNAKRTELLEVRDNYEEKYQF